VAHMRRKAIQWGSNRPDWPVLEAEEDTVGTSTPSSLNRRGVSVVSRFQVKIAQSRLKRLLGHGAVDALRRHHDRQFEESTRLAGLWQDYGLVFATTTGTPLNPSNLTSRFFKPLLKRVGLPDIRFHDLRHTCATLLLSKGVHPKLIQELLGHATIAITLDTYSHVLPGMGDQTANAMESVLE
jgi:integrase